MKANRPSVIALVLLLSLSSAASAFAQLSNGTPDSAIAKPATWFNVKEVADQVWRIDDHGNDNIYLVVGKEKALLIDAGLGVADLSACIRTLTPLPVLAVTTHGHLDHCGGDYQFSQLFAHLADSGMVLQSCSLELHKQMAEEAPRRYPEFGSLVNKDFSNFKVPELVPIQDGYLFDLGDRKLEVIETPGHTPGSVCLLDAENKLLFAGDNDNSLVWLFLKECLPLEEYVRSLRSLQKRSGEFTMILPGHGDPLDNDFIDEQVACGEQILSGACTGEPYKTFVDYARVCKYKRASIAFNPDNLHAEGK